MCLGGNNNSSKVQPLPAPPQTPTTIPAPTDPSGAKPPETGGIMRPAEPKTTSRDTGLTIPV